MCTKVCSTFSTIGNKLVSFIVDGELRKLKKELSRSKKAAFAEGTSKNLWLQWQSYFLFCMYFEFVSLPAGADTLCLYAQFLSRTFKSVDSIRNYISAVKTLHLLMDLPCPEFGKLELKLALRGLSRLKPHLTRQATPMTPKILEAIGNILVLSNPVHSTFWALFLIAFFTFSRKSNLVVTGNNTFNPEKQLCRADIRVGSRGLLVKFRWSKTNQFGKRELLVPVVAIPGSILCPVVAYKNMVRFNPASDTDPAFCICRSGKPVVPVKYSQLQKVLKTCVQVIGLDPKSFSSHSFRRGGATWAFRAGVPAELIKVHGDWASNAYLRYLDFSLQQKLEVAEGMVRNIVSG